MSEDVRNENSEKNLEHAIALGREMDTNESARAALVDEFADVVQHLGIDGQRRTTALRSAINIPAAPHELQLRDAQDKTARLYALSPNFSGWIALLRDVVQLLVEVKTTIDSTKTTTDDASKSNDGGAD